MAEETTDLVVDEDAPEADEKKRIDLHVDIEQSGPCKKHLKVTIPESEVGRFFNEQFSDLVKTASVPGFRPGKTPRKLIERRFRKDVADQVKSNLLMQSLQQIGEEQKIEPLGEPNLKLDTIELPEQGDFTYEFDVEVQPDFELPDYHGLEITRTIKEVSENEIDEQIDRLRSRAGISRVKEGGVAKGDTITVDVRIKKDGKVVSEVDDATIRVDDELLFRDGKISRFADGMAGAKAGDSRDLKITLSSELENEEVAGKELEAIFVVHSVKETDLAPLDETFFGMFGVGDLGELRDFVRSLLERRNRREQLDASRRQVVDRLLETTRFDLPNDLLRRQADRVLRQKVVEMSDGGYSEEEIRTKINQLRQDSLSGTARALRQQFLLQAIAEKESIVVEEQDEDEEMQAMAAEANESPRKTRARIEKEGLWDSVLLKIRERKTVDAVLSYAKIQHVHSAAATPVESISSIDATAVPQIAAPAAEENAEAAG